MELGGGVDVDPSGTLMEHRAVPVAPVTVVVIATEITPGPVNTRVAEKFPASSVVVFACTGLPAPEGVALITTGRPPREGETKPVTLMLTAAVN